MKPLVYFSRHGDAFSLNVTRFFYLTNHHYAGEQKWYMRLGRRPGRECSIGALLPYPRNNHER